MLDLLSQARQEGVDIACDVYPYPAGSTQLIHVLPPEVQAGGAGRPSSPGGHVGADGDRHGL